MDLKLVGSFISERRKEMEISQEELAEQLGVNVKVVARWENGKRFPASDFILPLCKILDVTANDLVSGKKVSDEEYKDFAEDNILKAVDARNVRKFTSIFSLVSICAALLAAISLLYVIVRVKMSEASGGETFEVNISEVDPRNATAIEMFAYCQYADSIGKGIEKSNFPSWNTVNRYLDPSGVFEFDYVVVFFLLVVLFY